MAGIPAWLLRKAGQDITIEPHLGAAGAGQRYGPGVPVRALVEEKRRRVRNTLGKEVVSNTTVRCQLDVNAPPESKVTLASGHVAYVINVVRQDGKRLPVPSHLEIALT